MSSDIMSQRFGIGASVLRKEDRRFITGRGRYTDDIDRPGQAHACFVRSPHAHAKLGEIGADAARAMPGVVAVFTGRDLAADNIGPLPCGWIVTDRHGEPHRSPPHFALARDKVRYVGDHVAVVIAETAAQAKDAAQAVEVDYEILPANVDTARALTAPQLHDEAPGNLCYDWEMGDESAVDEAFAASDHVTTIEFINNRLVPNAMEPRAAVAEYDPALDEYTLWLTNQNPHLLRLNLCAYVFGIPESKLRVVAPDVGGGFGSKIYTYAEDTVCIWAARKVGRPVKWAAERSESFMADAHARDHVTTAKLALDADGRFLAMKVDTIANMGAYLSNHATCIPSYLYATLLAGQYTTPLIHCRVQAVFNNTAMVDAYRGAGRPEAAFVVERLVEVAAREMGIDPVELRKRNFVPPDAFPYQTPVALEYDSGQYALAMDDALELVDYAGFNERRAESESRGKLRGIGFACYIEACGIAPSAVAGALGSLVGFWEVAHVRFNATGTVTVFSGAHSHGQGHETTFSQVVADTFGLPIENVEIVQGDTHRVPMGMGTYGSRSIAVGGAAIVAACDKIIHKGRRIAAHLMEAAGDDVEFDKGTYRVVGTDQTRTVTEVARAAYIPHDYPEDLEPGLEETAFYDPSNFTYPAGTHIAEVEIDPDTGMTEIVQWVAVDDFGKVINPMVVEGQVHGGIAQGVGQALFENCVYDTDSGQLVTGSFMDYCMPRSDDLPSFKVATIETPCPHNPLGVKGCGEAGAIAAPAALMNAITDALGHEDIAMPAAPEEVWRAVQSRRQAAA